MVSTAISRKSAPPFVVSQYPRRISPEKLAALKAASPIADVIGEFIDLHRSGSRLIGCCPGHRSKSGRSFQVSPQFGFWKCWGGCGEGDALDFLQWHLGLSFAGAVARLANRVGFDLDADIPNDAAFTVSAGRELKEINEQFRAAERAELIRLGRELADVRGLLRDASRRLSEIERGYPVHWPDEKETCVEAIALAIDELRDLDATYCLLAFGRETERERFLAIPEERESLIQNALACGYVANERGVRHQVGI